jgi:hypothetical protein
MNSRDLFEHTPLWQHSSEEEEETHKKLGIVGNLADTLTPYLPRYDPNNSVNTATMTGHRIGVRFPAEEKIFMFVTALRMAMGSMQLRTTVSFMGVKRPECRPIHTLPSGDEV